MGIVRVRAATEDDILCIAALGVQVFLDTYATEGVRPDLAREAFGDHSIETLEERLSPHGGASIDLAVDGEHVLGFAEAELAPRAPLPGRAPGRELARLYVQPRHQRRGIGRALLEAAERRAVADGLPALWLTAWKGNANARAFYARCGFDDVGSAWHVFENRRYENRVLVKPLAVQTRTGGRNGS